MSLTSVLTGIAGGFLTGGPAGAAAGGVLGAFGGGKPAPQPPPPTPIGIGGAINMGGPFGVTASGRLNLPWNNAAPATVAAGQAAPRGYHLNKHALPACKSHGAVAAHTIYVRNRRMNPLNPRALRKALHREKAARKLMSKLHIFSHTRRAAPKRKR